MKGVKDPVITYFVDYDKDFNLIQSNSMQNSEHSSDMDENQETDSEGRYTDGEDEEEEKEGENDEEDIRNTRL